MIKKFIYIFTAISGILAGVSSCSLDIPPADQYSDPDAITNVSTARSLLTSAYLLYPHYEYELSILGDDFCQTSITGKDMSQKNLYLWQDNSITSFAETIWLEYYNTIASCNTLLERVDNIVLENASEESAKAAIISECKALKALCYFNLLRLFAPAYEKDPQADGIVLKERLGLEFPKRSSIEDCVSAIRTLLTDAADTENDPERNGWLSQTAVYYLIAELELYAGQYGQAAIYAEKILEQATDDMFTVAGYKRLWETASCKERIFAFYTAKSYYADIQFNETSGDYFALNPQIVYGEEDIRKTYNVYPFEMEGEQRNLLGKYNKVNKDSESIQYINIMRYAGAYFIATEAYSRMVGKEDVAIRKLNEYLAACQATTLDEGLTGNALLQAIHLEKMKEFAGEGILYFDLKRLHSGSLSRLAKWGSSEDVKIESSDYRWCFPIPRSEYKYNENMTQNEGWPLNR